MVIRMDAVIADWVDEEPAVENEITGLLLVGVGNRFHRRKLRGWKAR